MPKAGQITVPVQEQTSKSELSQIEDIRPNTAELLLKKITLAALTMLGIGYILTNVPIGLLTVNSISNIPIASQEAVNAISGRLLFLMSSMISALLGGLFIYGAVQFYERGETRRMALLGVLMASFQLLCLGVGSTLLLPKINLPALMLTFGSVIIAASAITYLIPDKNHQLIGASLGVVGGGTLAYAIFNLRIYDLIFAWNIPFTGPFMSLVILESLVVILAPVVALVHAALKKQPRERLLPYSLVLLIALVYGVGAFIGALVLSMNFWNLIWKAPWLGPLHGMSDSILTTVVFWSASLVLLDIGGILLIIAACLGFVHVSREFSRL